MKIKNRYRIPLVARMFQTTTIARFGPARLVKHIAGHHELIGGTAEHHAAAREWCSIFAPEIVFIGQPMAQTGRVLRRVRLPQILCPDKLEDALTLDNFRRKLVR